MDCFPWLLLPTPTPVADPAYPEDNTGPKWKYNQYTNDKSCSLEK